MKTIASIFTVVSFLVSPALGNQQFHQGVLIDSSNIQIENSKHLIICRVSVTEEIEWLTDLIDEDRWHGVGLKGSNHLITNIQVYWDETAFNFQLSSFIDLMNPYDIHLIQKGTNMQLVLRSVEGGEMYIVEYLFDGEGLKSRYLYNPTCPRSCWQKTSYGKDLQKGL